MRVEVGSDERTHTTDAVAANLEARGCEVEFVGPLAGNADPWPQVARKVAERVVSGACDQGVLFCWTGTGVSIAANKVPGVRAALCGDAQTAAGARAWNQANVLCLSLAATSEATAAEILEAWFSASADASEEENVGKVKRLDEKYRPAAPLAAEGRKGELSG